LPSRPLDVLIIGSGFAGIGMAIRLKQSGIASFLILEKEAELGGTWYVNRYPGCACDVQSHLYSFSFEPNPEWSRMFASQPEIWRYLKRCADKHGLAAHLRLNTEVAGAEWDEGAGLWHVRTAGGERHSARALVSAVGGLSRPVVPDLPGLREFRGKTFHSQRWDHGYDLAGKRVAVVGTGASAIQFVPQIAPKVAQLDLYQRTPPWIIAKPDREIGWWERLLYKTAPASQKAFRNAIYWQLEARAVGFTVNPRLMKLPERWARSHIRRQIADPELRRKVTPDYTIGCKRVLISDDYYPALARPNVELVTGGARGVTAGGVVDAQGRERPVDAIIFGTGFDVGNVLGPLQVRGRGGVEIRDAWTDVPQAYLGTTVAGFPNLFLLTGPNTGLGHNSLIYMIEAQVEYVLGALKLMKRRRLKAVEVRADVMRAFNAGLQRQNRRNVWNSGCKSWYLDAQGRNFTLWPTFTWKFRELTRVFRAADYELIREGQRRAPAAAAAEAA
jgi:cation diffusion facilitator CzcD-associated flavoprotein CzcO